MSNIQRSRSSLSKVLMMLIVALISTAHLAKAEESLKAELQPALQRQRAELLRLYQSTHPKLSGEELERNFEAWRAKNGIQFNDERLVELSKRGHSRRGVGWAAGITGALLALYKANQAFASTRSDNSPVLDERAVSTAKAPAAASAPLAEASAATAASAASGSASSAK